ncbi:hypothetical protein BK816_08920 [Boudabousia tangfeifanii]|uniref:Uncharacterized protein n=1 Tax=Boudabousia tangfeifanii TaxID=1912795 RepID=A0A1D9MMG0_9ACTO|nr:transglycosylase domain-containing protein [Boudabousia tangfeifanii]AOZ73379.1 hypothetical protein BK816_08920 [Boudabousia tangfeifanii]
MSNTNSQQQNLNVPPPPPPSRRAVNAQKEAKAPKPRRPWYQRLGFIFLWLLFFGIIFAGIVFIASYVMIKVPEVDDAVRSQRTTVFYSDGTSEIGSLSEIDRTIIDTNQIPKYVGQAVVASEDRTFFENNGVDVKGIVRALINNLQGKPRQGASTLTQQYVENYYTGDEGGYVGKYREAILALKINQNQTKQEILNNYLNTIYFGRNSYGIEAAAQAYFGKSAKDLSISEAALIAGIIPAPSKWDPAKNLEQAQKRWKRVISLMAEDHWITEAQANEAVFPKFLENTSRARRAGNSGYLLDQVSKELVNAGIKESDLATAGYQIFTTIDKPRQEEMARTVMDMPEGHAPNLHVAMIAVDNKTGSIVAEYPGSNYGESQRNRVTEDTLNAGSTFKVFGLLSALENGKTIYSRVSGSSPASFKNYPGYHPTNFGGISFGMVTLRKATEYSINTAFLRMNNLIGPEKTKEMAIRMGIPENTPGLDNYLPNVLGTASVHPIDLARAYATLGNYGQQPTIHMVREVKNSSGDVVYTGPTSTKEVIDPQVAKNALVAMRDVVESGSGEKARLGNGWQVAGKTGTSQDNRSALFAGITPKWTTVVGLYQVGPGGTQEEITPFGGYKEITGGSIPAEMWHTFMADALGEEEGQKFEKPDSWNSNLKVKPRGESEKADEKSDQKQQDNDDEDEPAPKKPEPKEEKSEDQQPAPAPAPAPKDEQKAPSEPAPKEPVKEEPKAPEQPKSEPQKPSVQSGKNAKTGEQKSNKQPATEPQKPSVQSGKNAKTGDDPKKP